MNDITLLKKNEISFFDILNFIWQSRKIFFITCAFGLVLAIFYIIITPKKYSAEAIINILTIPTSNTMRGSRVEELANIQAMLSYENQFDDRLLNDCATQNDNLPKMVKAIALKGTSGSFKLVVTASTATIASSCTKSIGDFILKKQQDFYEFQLGRMKNRVEVLNSRLSKDRAWLLKLNPSHNLVAPIYFELQKQIRILEDEKDRLEALMDTPLDSNSLVFAVNSSEKPIYPKALNVLILGFIGGFIVGFLISFLSKYIPKFGFRFNKYQ
jgi:capsular polysaccharide biosynthesis protein